MKSSKDATIFIDLSFLSAEEEGIIRQVLLRDENLKRLEIGRVRRLRNLVPDPKQLKVLSGEWFEEIRAKRHGRQPDISAVVRSSMRWKKTAGHKPNPFLHAVTEDKGEEKEHSTTCAQLTDDPRSLHPAFDIEGCRAYTDDDITLEDETQPVQSLAKSVPSQNPSQKPSKKPTDKATEKSTEKPFILRSLANLSNPILGISDPEAKPVDEPIYSAPPSPQLEPVLEQNLSVTKNTTTNAVTADARPNASLSLTEQKNKSFEENLVKRSPESNKSFEKNLVKISLEAEKPKLTEVKIRPKPNDRCIPVETLEITSFTETQGISNQDQSRQLDRAVESSNTEVEVSPKVEDGKMTSSSKQTKIEVKPTQSHTKHMMNKEGPEFEEEVALRQSLHRDSKNTHELIAGSLQGLENSDVLPTISSVEKMIKQVPLSNTVPQTQTENREISAASFRRSSPTRMDVLSIDLNMDENACITEDQKIEAFNNLNKPKDVSLDQNSLLDINRDILTEVLVTGAVPRSKGDFDVEPKDSESADKKFFELEQTDKIKTVGMLWSREQSQTFSDVADVRGTSTEDSRRESDILASVYERALKAKAPMSKNTSTQNPKQEKAEIAIPTIVVMSSESEDPNKIDSLKNGSPGPETSAEVAIPVAPSFIADVWEDEGVDSVDDSSSVSSCGSDHSERRPVSASTISVTERSGSLLSVYSDAGDFGNVTVQGAVEFALMYSPLGELVIMVEQCQDLAIANPRKQRTDPYVKTYLYPDKRSKRKTSIKKCTVNPVFVESLRYKVKREELPAKTLNLSVWHNDSRGRNVFLGQVEISLRAWDWKHEALTWYNLQPKSKDNQETQEFCGLLSISLKYVPPESTGSSKLSTGEIHIWLREARRLRRLKTQGVDSFVKCYMLPDTSKKSRQKTRVVKKTQDPVYNHAMVYDGFRSGEVREACCELTVWDNNKFSNQFLGGLRLGLGTGQSYGKKVDWMDSANGEVEIWERMLASTNSWVEAELPLRSSMTPRK